MAAKRIIYLDILKIISCICVVIIHVTATGFIEMPLLSTGWNLTVIFNTMARFAVLVFVMVSGAIFLDDKRELDLKRLWKKNILHLAIIYVFWTVVYSVFNSYSKLRYININYVIQDSIKNSYYHLWFIPMLTGIYIFIPILKKIVKDKKLVEYFLIIFVIFNIIPYTFSLFQVPIIQNIIDRLEIPYLSFVGYFILGYYLNTFEITKNKRKIIYLLGIISLVIMIVVTMWFCYYVKRDVSLGKEFSVTTFIYSIAVFVFIKYTFNEKNISDKIQKLIIHFSKISLGIYIIHPLFIDIMKNNLHISFNNVFKLPLITISVIVLSYLLAYLLSKIPMVNKYII